MMKACYEILDEVAKATNDQDRKAILYYNRNYTLKMLLRAAYHPNIKFVFERVPYYKPSDSPPGLAPTTLHMEINRIYLFEENNPHVSPDLTFDRKETLLIQMLESLESREATVLMNAMLKDLKVPGLTKELALEVFPDLLQ